MDKELKLNLQMFADGAASSAPTGTDAGGATGEGAQAAAVQQNRALTREERTRAAMERQEKFLQGSQAAAGQVETPQTPQEPTFDDLIKGKYKADYDGKVQGIVKERLKNSKQAESTLEALNPAIEKMAKKYGVDPADPGALAQAILNDDDHYEQEALEKGLPIETVKELDRMKREAEALKAQQEQLEREERIQGRFNELAAEFPAMKELYPGFDMKQELENPKFAFLVDPNAPVKFSLKEAYQAVHGEEILAAGMQYADQKGAQKVARSIQANARRPSENGMGNVGASQTQQRPLSQMTDAEKSKYLQSIRERVKREGTLDTLY